MLPEGSPIQIAFDAGRGEVYAASATPNDQPFGWTIGPPSLQTTDTWLASLPPRSIVSGPAVARLVGALTAAAHRVAPPKAWLPNALSAAHVGIRRAAAHQLDDPASLVPHYLRPSYAEER
jgi:tRNA A37 threonylcarbamoyladenosine modification protein TsaB